MGVVEVLDPVRPARAGGWKVDVSRGERNGRVSSEWFNRPDDERLAARDFDRQVAEFQVRVAVLNGFTALGIPVTEGFCRKFCWSLSAGIART